MKMSELEPLPHEKKDRVIEVIVFWILLILSTLLMCTAVKAQDTNIYSVMEVRSYIRWFHRDTNQKRMENAFYLANHVVESAEKYKVDHLLIAVIISLESSWRVAGRNGTAGEVGLMQVMPGGVCDTGNLKTPRGQIDAGARCLHLSREKCGDDITKIFTMYASGKCVSKSKRTQRKMKIRVRQYRRAVDMHRMKEEQ